MWELICHHTYKLTSIPVDLSDYNSNGRPERLTDNDFGPNGITDGSGIVNFPGRGSRIRIPSSTAWNPLVGLCIDVLARFSSEVPLGFVRQRTLVAGHNSFSFQVFIRQLSASFLGDSIGINTTDHSVGGQVHNVPLDRWISVRFLHDGLNIAELYIDDKLVAQRTDVTVAIPPVGPKGVSIGNDINRDDFFLAHCEVDDVKIWRLDPHHMRRKFLSRPLDAAAIDCWERLFRLIKGALAEDRECYEQLKHLLSKEIERQHRAILALGPNAYQRYIEICDEYARLWKTGQLESPRMASLVSDWCGLLQQTGFKPSARLELFEAINSCLGNVLKESSLLDCDPQAVAFIKLLIDCLGQNRMASQEDEYVK